MLCSARAALQVLRSRRGFSFMSRSALLCEFCGAEGDFLSGRGALLSEFLRGREAHPSARGALAGGKSPQFYSDRNGQGPFISLDIIFSCTHSHHQ